MTLLELLKLLKQHVGRIVLITVLGGILGFGGMFAKNLIKPSYTATATLAATGGSLSSVGGIASIVASDNSASGVAVSAKTDSTKNSVTITATGANQQAVVDAANKALSETQSKVTSQQAATATTPSKAESATSNGKSPLLYGFAGALGSLFVVVCWYVAKDSLHGSVWDWRSVEGEAKLTFLGELLADRDQLNLVCANLALSGKASHSACKNVLLVPTGEDVNAVQAARLIASAKDSSGAAINLALGAPLAKSPEVLYDARSADSVVAIVEEGKSTLEEVETLMRELAIAGVEPTGFVYLPARAKG